MTSLFIIEKLAPITQYQDLGRFGHLDNGFSHSGAMDTLAFRINNRLLDNSDNATQLEIALGGLQLRALADCTIAISGAYLNPTLNGQPLVNFCACRIAVGDILAFAFANPKHLTGQYAYLAVAGGFTVTPFLGSTATTQRLNIFPDGELVVGSVLSGDVILVPKLQGEPRQQLPNYRGKVIKVIPAYQYQQFSAEEKQRFIAQTFTVKATNRMGTKLSAQQPIIYGGEELLSEGITLGAIQIPSDGNPIVLQKDAQSIGGYPKIGIVAEPYRSLLAQLPVGRKVRFAF